MVLCTSIGGKKHGWVSLFKSWDNIKREYRISQKGTDNLILLYIMLALIAGWSSARERSSKLYRPCKALGSNALWKATPSLQRLWKYLVTTMYGNQVTVMSYTRHKLHMYTS